MGKSNAGTLAYTVFAIRAMYFVQSISLTSVVRLKCNGLNTSTQKCIGTYILPNTLLTTSYCAIKCQQAENAPIIQKFIRTNYRNYVVVNGNILNNDIALLVTNSTRTKYVKLSVLDHMSPLGQKALMPIMSKKRLKMHEVVILRCTENYDLQAGYYVCTNSILTHDIIKMCEEGKEKWENGTPLFLDDKLYGIMSLRSKDTCIIPQKRFTAIEPALPWITSIAEKLVANARKTNVNHAKNEGIVLRSQSSLNKWRVLAAKFNISSAQTDLNETEYFNSDEMSNPIEKESEDGLWKRENHIDLIGQKLRELKKSNLYYDILRGGRTETTVTESTSPTEIAPLRPFGETAITYKPRPRTKNIVKIPITPSSSSSTTHMIPFVKDLGNNKSTNIMDWFRNEVKRVDEHPQFLIVTTTTTVKPDFLDLT